jgi:hypothetical protein
LCGAALPTHQEKSALENHAINPAANKTATHENNRRLLAGAMVMFALTARAIDQSGIYNVLDYGEATHCFTKDAIGVSITGKAPDKAIE